MYNFGEMAAIALNPEVAVERQARAYRALAAQERREVEMNRRCSLHSPPRSGFELWFGDDSWAIARSRGQSYADWEEHLQEEQLFAPPPQVG